MLSHFSHVQLFETQWTVALHTPLSMKFSRKNAGEGCCALLKGNLPNPWIEPTSTCIGKWVSLPQAPPGKLYLLGSSQFTLTC